MKKKVTKKEIKIEKEASIMFSGYLKRHGLKMSKKISSGGGGLFNFSSPTYDKRTVYNKKDLAKLSKEGFSADEEMGNWIFNMFWTQMEL